MKLKCDNPKCELFDKELDELEAIVTVQAVYSEKEQTYIVPPSIPTRRQEVKK